MEQNTKAAALLEQILPQGVSSPHLKDVVATSRSCDCCSASRATASSVARSGARWPTRRGASRKIMDVVSCPIEISDCVVLSL